MRRLFALSAVLGVLLAAAAPAGAAPASNPSMLDLAPANYGVLTVGSGIELQFSCPNYNTTYSGAKNYTSYFVHVATNPLRSIEGDFSARNEVATLSAIPIPGTEDCVAYLGEPITKTPDTYYWFAERINCDARYCAEFSPISAFSIVKPIPPGGSGKQPKGSMGGVPYRNVYVGCEANKEAESMSACTEFDTMTAFFESNLPVQYKLCVRSPKGKTHCSTREAAPYKLDIYKIPGRELGCYRVTWTVEGQTITRYLRRLR